MEINMNDVNDMNLGFSDENVEKFKKICLDAGGYFSLVPEQLFSCLMAGQENTIRVTNVAYCFADTDDCKSTDPLLVMESVWQNMGLQCRKQGDDGDSDNEENDGFANGVGDATSAEVSALGLTESEVACMHDSDGFLQNSEQLSAASAKYAKAVIMTDPTKLGFPADAAQDMEGVCKNNGGMWSVVTSEDIICVIQGRDRRINVYNFGNCIPKTDDCQDLDPIVLVKGFFWEILNFKCSTMEEYAANPSTHSSVPPPTKPGTTFGAPLPQAQAQADDGGLPGYATVVIVLCVVAAIGVFAYYKASKGQDRRSYEITDVSDLRFDNFIS
jgi:hypothetical protein